MDEKDLINKIKRSANSIEPPKSLTPARITKRLEEQKPPQNPPAEPRKNRRLPIYRLGAAAAVFILALTAVWTFNHIPGPKPSKGESTAVSHGLREETEAPATETAVLKAQTEAAALEVQTDIAYGETSNPAASDSSPDGKVVPIKSYDALYAALTADQSRSGIHDAGTGSFNGSETKTAALEEGMTESTSIEYGSADVLEDADYSKTNLQEVGVDEGDIVKTDGSFLYVLDSSNQLRILKAKGSKLSESGKISFPDFSEVIQEFYLDKDTLNIITEKFSTRMEENSGSDPHSGGTASSDMDASYDVLRESSTKLYTYDVSDRTLPRLLGSTVQDGSYRTSRKVGGYIYLFSEYTPLLKEKQKDSLYIPRAGRTALEESDIYLPEYLNTASSLVLTSVNTQNPNRILAHKSIVSATELYYVSQENIYICNSAWTSDGSSTQLLKFHFEDGDISPISAAEVKGYLNNSFSLNEYEGNLRLVTTSTNNEGSTTNGLYIFDEALNPCGRLDNLADNETIRSARFMGNTGYFVTYRQTDPLFSIDLTDPQKPKLLGELKITGFSSYLHFYGKDLLLGIGYEVDPDTGEYKGIKLSMFDISDPANVREKHKYVINNANGSQALENYKAVMIDPEKNLFGLHCHTDADNYMVFSYDPQKGFDNQLAYTFQGTEEYQDNAYNIRGLYIKDTFYLAYTQKGQSGILSFDMKNQFADSDKFLLK